MKADLSFAGETCDFSSTTSNTPAAQESSVTTQMDIDTPGSPIMAPKTPVPAKQAKSARKSKSDAKYRPPKGSKAGKKETSTIDIDEASVNNEPASAAPLNSSHKPHPRYKFSIPKAFAVPSNSQTLPKFSMSLSMAKPKLSLPTDLVVPRHDNASYRLSPSGPTVAHPEYPFDPKYGIRPRRTPLSPFHNAKNSSAKS